MTHGTQAVIACRGRVRTGVRGGADRGPGHGEGRPRRHNQHGRPSKPVSATSTTGDTSTTTGVEDCSGPPLSTYGVASLTAAIVGMTTLGDRAYVVARGQNPPLLGEIDLTSRTLTRTVRLGRGEGGWAATVSGGQVYLGTYPFPDIYRFDPATGEVKLIGTVGPSGGFVWCLTTAPDGTVYSRHFAARRSVGVQAGHRHPAQSRQRRARPAVRTSDRRRRPVRLRGHAAVRICRRVRPDDRCEDEPRMRRPTAARPP